MILAATGHRPDKLGGYGDDVLDRLRRGARRYMERRGDVSTAISGMALGWDTAWAMAAIDLGIPLIAAVPFTGQESRWPEASQVRYRELLGKAARVEIVCAGGYSASKMHKRNEWMVDHCDELVALWDGSDGGTANCVAYATFCEKPIDHLWPQWSGRPPLNKGRIP